jgi:hypothetical protein
VSYRLSSRSRLKPLRTKNSPALHRRFGSDRQRSERSGKWGTAWGLLRASCRAYPTAFWGSRQKRRAPNQWRAPLLGSALPRGVQSRARSCLPAQHARVKVATPDVSGQTNLFTAMLWLASNLIGGIGPSEQTGTDRPPEWLHVRLAQQPPSAWHR